MVFGEMQLLQPALETSTGGLKPPCPIPKDLDSMVQCQLVLR